jgi:acetyl-CoA carboxylase biotin carboxyl carrier protein
MQTAYSIWNRFKNRFLNLFRKPQSATLQPRETGQIERHMDVTELESLVALVQKANVRELTLRQGEARITIRKSLLEPAGSAPFSHAHSLPSEPPASESEMHYEERTGEVGLEETVFIISPLVGVFHHTSPVVALGAAVKVGQTVGVIESMNLVHEVEATESGVVTDVLIEDGVVVEYGQQLFALRSDGV